jgi:hypothetical protein
MDYVFYVHYIDAYGRQQAEGPFCSHRDTEVAARTAEAAGARNVTVVKDRGYGLTADDFEGC